MDIKIFGVAYDKWREWLSLCERRSSRQQPQTAAATLGDVVLKCELHYWSSFY